MLPWFGNQFAGKLAVASSPDVHLLRLFDEVVAEIRMRDRDQSLGSLPGTIVGDKKYGATTNPLRRLGLHAHAFGFIHPVTKKKYEFKVDCPKEFYGKK